MVAATAQEAVPKYFPDSLDLPLPPEHKTWHTERLCPPLLVQALRSERLAIFIAQLHYWLQKEDVGVYKHGFHWIYNAEWEWREQFPWLSEHTIGRIRRALERLGYVVSNDFNRNPLDRTKHSTLDYHLIAQQTGWNPIGLDLNRKYPRPPVFKKGIKERGRHKSDSTALVYLPVDGDEPDSPKPPEIVDSALKQNASCKNVTMHSAPLPLSSIYKEVPLISKSNLETDLKIELQESSQKVGGSQLLGNEDTPHKADEQKEVNSCITESRDEDQHSAVASLVNDEEIEAAQQFLASLNTKVECAERERTLYSGLTRPIRIQSLDEIAHEILWKYQAQLESLNVDLNAERIQQAIVDNPQHLEDAIRAFLENSAKGAKTPDAATGFLYNALRQGWKPRQSSSSTGAGVQVYTPPPQMLAEPLPPTLEQLVESKRAAWQNALILRPSISAWVEQTPGVIMTPDGPARADATNQASQPDNEPKVASHQVTPAATGRKLPSENATSPKLDPLTRFEVEPSQEISSKPPQPEVDKVNLVVSNQMPLPSETAANAAFVLSTKPSPSKPPIAKPQPPSNRRLQPVEILTSAGEWIAGYFVHSCIAVANLAGQERQFTLFNADGQMCCFWGQIRPTA